MKPLDQPAMPDPLRTQRRRTVVVADGYAQRWMRLQAVRQTAHGLQVMQIEQLVARLAGGFCRPVDHDSLLAAVRTVLPVTRLGELEAIKDLPGMVDAAAGTLRKVWDAGIDLQARAAQHPRLEALAALERAVLSALPAGMCKPADLVALALQRVRHAPAVFGAVELFGLGELAPCWRPVLEALAAEQEVRWHSGARPPPPWLAATKVQSLTLLASRPEIELVSAANAAHEAIEAMRWVRSLLASGKAQPHEIAIAAASTAEFDDHFLALSRDAALGVHFVHGVPALSTRAGQCCAALADILCHGLTQLRLGRLARLCGRERGLLAGLPDGWLKVLPEDRVLANATEWWRALENLAPDAWPDAHDHGPLLRSVVEQLLAGVTLAEKSGEDFLSGQALALWRKALAAGPAAALPLTLASQKVSDELDGCTSVTWMPAAVLAATPRRFVRLLGLNAGLWPRGRSEDALLPDHVLSARELDPIPLSQSDCEVFDAIRRNTGGELVLSRARRDSKGRVLGVSRLLHDLHELPAARFLRRHVAPAQAFSETDRLQALPTEFRSLPQARSAYRCWTNWQRNDITPHDGHVRADHPVLTTVAMRTHSATSLRGLLRNPLGYLWRHALGWRGKEISSERLSLDSRNFGNLVHLLLERAVQQLEVAGGLATASTEAKQAVIAACLADIAQQWPREQAVPPTLIWQATLQQAADIGLAALCLPETLIAGARAYVEVPFGNAAEQFDAAKHPWDPSRPIVIPGTALRIRGYIDRLDLLADGQGIQVCDYKTGGLPTKKEYVLEGGKELQRCLYAYAVQTLLGDDKVVTASLLYPRDAKVFPLAQPGDVMSALAGYLRQAHASLLAGNCLPGPDTGDTYDEFSLLLPANAVDVYCKKKALAARTMMGAAADIWDAE